MSKVAEYIYSIFDDIREVRDEVDKFLFGDPNFMPLPEHHIDSQKHLAEKLDTIVDRLKAMSDNQVDGEVNRWADAIYVRMASGYFGAYKFSRSLLIVEQYLRKLGLHELYDEYCEEK